MGLLKKLQARLLKGDLSKGRSLVYLADKYPMSLLMENKIFFRYGDSELYWDKHEPLLFNIAGECLGEICSFLPETSKYIIVNDVVSKCADDVCAVLTTEAARYEKLKGFIDSFI